MFSDQDILAFTEHSIDPTIKDLAKEVQFLRNLVSQCPTCNGSGTVYEEHHPWAIEPLSCNDCCGSGKFPKPIHDLQPVFDVCQQYSITPQGIVDVIEIALDPDEWDENWAAIPQYLLKVAREEESNSDSL